MRYVVLCMLLVLFLGSPTLTGAGAMSSPKASAGIPPLLSNSPRDALWITDDPVRYAEVVGDLAYISGMSHVGPYTGLAAPLDVATGVALSPFPRPDGNLDAGVLSLASDGNGGWYLGGSFSQVDGMVRRGLAHALPDGALDPQWEPATDGPVYTLVVTGTTVYIGGKFTQVDGVQRLNLAAFDTVTGALTPWNPEADGSVYALAAAGDTLYAGGGFERAGGQYRPYAAQLDAASGQASWWNPLPNGPVYALVVKGSTVWAGGYFSSIGWASHSNIAALNATTGQALGWGGSISGANASVSALAVGADTVYAGGYFDFANGGACANLVYLNEATGATRRCPATDGYGPDALLLNGSTLYAGGQFHTIAGQPRENLAALDAVSGGVSGWNPAPAVAVRALAVSGSVVYVGGYFRSIGMVPGTMAAIDLDTGQPAAWAPEIEGAGGVGPFVISGTVAYVGGTFSDIGGQARFRLAAIDLVTGLATDWNPLIPTSTFAEIRSMVRIGSTIYIGGSIQQLNGIQRHHLAAIDAATGEVLPWAPKADYPVNTLLAGVDVIYAGGEFWEIDGVGSRGVVALDATSGQIIPWDPPNLGGGGVYSLLLDRGTLYVGGSFTMMGGQPRDHLAAIDLSTRRLTGWNPGASAAVYSLAISGDTLYLGGHFGSVGGQPRNRLAALDVVTGLPNAWNPSLQYYPPYALVAMGDSLLVGGNFSFVGMQGRTNLVAFDPRTEPYEAGVSITKTDALDYVMPEASHSYTVTVSNAGPDPAGVLVTDVFPTAYDLDTWFCRAGSFSRCGMDGGTGNISVTLTVGPGDSVVVFTEGQVRRTARGTLVNTAAVAPPPGVMDPDLSDNSSTDMTTIGGAYGVVLPLLLRD